MLQTYAIFSYICGEIQWSSLGRNRAAVVGFNAEGDFFGNHPLSGFSDIGDAVSCTFDAGKKRRKRAGARCVSMPLPLPNDPVIRRLVQQCLDVYNSDRLLLNVERRFRPNITNQVLATRLDPCPCFLTQVTADTARFMQLPDSPSCYVSSTSVTESLQLEPIQLTQMCCYDDNG